MCEPANNSLLTELTCQLLSTVTVWVDMVHQTNPSFLLTPLINMSNISRFENFVYVSCSPADVGAACSKHKQLTELASNGRHAFNPILANVRTYFSIMMMMMIDTFYGSFENGSFFSD